MITYGSLKMIALVLLFLANFTHLKGMEQEFSLEPEQLIVMDLRGIREAIDDGNVHYDRLLQYILVDSPKSVNLTKKIAIVKMLIDAGVLLNRRIGNQFLLVTVLNNESSELVKLVLEAGADPSHGFPLRTANAQTIQLFLEAGGSPDAMIHNEVFGSEFPEDVVVFVDEATRRKIIRLLVEYGADLNFTRRVGTESLVLDAFNNDPIIQSIVFHDRDTAQRLLIELTNPSVLENEALQSRLNEIFLISIVQGETRISDYILEHFSDYVSLDDALIAAARRGNLTYVDRIIERNGDELSSGSLAAAMDIAARRRHTGVVRYMLSWDQSRRRIDLRTAFNRMALIVRRDHRINPGINPVYREIHELLATESAMRSMGGLGQTVPSNQSSTLPVALGTQTTGNVGCHLF